MFISTQSSISCWGSVTSPLAWFITLEGECPRVPKNAYIMDVKKHIVAKFYKSCSVLPLCQPKDP